MDYEKKYKEVLKVIENLYNVVRYQSSSDALLTSQTLEKAFPELKESEDEMVRKAIVKIISDIDGGFPFEKHGIIKKNALAWLENQGKSVRVEAAMKELEEKSRLFTEAHKGESSDEILAEMRGEHKPIEENKGNLGGISPKWSEEDERAIGIIKIALEHPYDMEGKWDRMFTLDWLKSLKNRVLPQPKQEWSEEDEKISKDVTHYLYNNVPDMDDLSNMINWLKSLKQRIV